MTTNADRASATIYQFPARGRYAAANGEDRSIAAVQPPPRGAVRMVSGGAWYHDEAIQRDERERS